MTDFGSGQPLIEHISDAIRNPHPLALVELASTYAQLTAPDPFTDLREMSGVDAAEEEKPRVTRDELIESFLDVGARETDALLLVWAEMLGDEDLRTRIIREVRHRRPSLPRWLQHVDEIKPVRAVESTHILGDGDNVVLGIETPGRSFTIMLYVDHNMGTIVKDAFVVDRPISDVLVRLHSASGDDIAVEELLLEDARAKATQAVEATASIFPPFETDTWPQLKPLVDWMLRTMPGGGEGYAYEPPTDEEFDQLADGFMSSEFAVGLGKDAEDQAHTLLNFAANYGTGDPLRWSGVSVEVMLLDLIPRKIIADQKYLRGIPSVMRALVRFSHDRLGIPPRYTAQTLDVVEQLTPEYLEVVSASRRQGPEALLERMGMLPPLDADADAEPDWTIDPDLSDDEYFLRRLASKAGDLAALDALTVTPLSDEPLDLSDVDADIAPRMANIPTISDAACTEYIHDVELCTVARRLLPRIAATDPAIFRRRSRDDTAAAAVCWIAAKANGLFSHRAPTSVGAMMAHFGLTGSPTQRAQPMLAALGVKPWEYEVELGDAALLTASARKEIIRRRDLLREQSTNDSD